jgi:hypothetical protein
MLVHYKGWAVNRDNLGTRGEEKNGSLGARLNLLRPLTRVLKGTEMFLMRRPADLIYGVLKKT